MSIVEMRGNLFETDAHMIGHGVNCCGVMGKGIAVQFKNRFPEMYKEYVDDCLHGRLNPGDATFYNVTPERETNRLVIANLASQDKPGPNARYGWAIKSIGRALDEADDRGFGMLAIPRIGCGIGGLDWAQMYYELVDKFESHTVDLEIWSFE